MKKLFLLVAFLLLIPIYCFAGFGYGKVIAGGGAVASSSTPVAFDAGSEAAGSNGITTLSWSHTVAGSNKILIVMVGVNGSPISGITYNGDALTHLYNVNYAGTVPQDVWYLLNPDSGANTIQVSFSTTVDYPYALAASFTGAAQSAPEYNSENNSGTTLSVVVTASSGDLVVDTARGANELTVDASQTVAVMHEGSGNLLGISYETATGNTTMSWTQVDSYWSIGGFTLERANP